MATGTNHKAHATLISTEEGVGWLSDEVKDDPSWAKRMNGVLPGNHPWFTESKESDLKPEGFKASVLDAHGGLYMSSQDGAAAMGDLGIDLVKVDHPIVSAGVGYYADTGFNIGKQGGRAAFLGFGVEYNVKEKEDENAEMTIHDWSGLGITLPTFKARLGWSSSKAKAEDAAPPAAAAAAAPSAAEPAAAVATGA